MYDLRIVNGLVFTNNQFTKTNIYIKDGLISRLSPEILESKETYDCKGNQVIPGIIDPHTHFDLDLSFTTSKDDFYTGTVAAAYGGVTTIIDFLDPIEKASLLQESFEKRLNQATKSVIDYKFHACLKNPKNEVMKIVNELPKYGLNTVKIFTTYSDSNRRTYDTEIKELLQLTKTHHFTLTAHIENDDLIITNKEDSHLELPNNRPTASETTEALKLAKLIEETKGTLYMVHLSSGETLKQLTQQYNHILNKNFIIESCPHYFVWNKDIIKEKEGYLYTMAPPLRSKKEQELLQNHIQNVYTIGTDHCPFHHKEKQKEKLYEIPLGIGGVEESFRIMYTMFGDAIIPKMTSNVAKAHHLYPQKGVIQVGSDADMFIYHIENTTIENTHTNADHNLYQNKPVNGEIISTISRGNFVIKDKLLIKHKGTLLNKIGGTYEGN